MAIHLFNDKLSSLIHWTWHSSIGTSPPKKNCFPLHVETSSCQSGPDKPTIELCHWRTFEGSEDDWWSSARNSCSTLRSLQSTLQGQKCDFVVPCLAETPHPQGAAAVRYLATCMGPRVWQGAPSWSICATDSWATHHFRQAKFSIFLSTVILKT